MGCARGRASLLRDMTLLRRASFSAALTLLLAACAVDGSHNERESATTSEDGITSVGRGDADGELPASGVALLETERGPLRLTYTRVDGVALAEGDIIVPREGTLNSAATKWAWRRWPLARVPFEISGDLPDAARVTDAIAHWEAQTSIRFVARTTEPDYVQFRSGTGCSANIGKKGGLQHVNLSTGESGSTLVAVAVNRADDRVYYFYERGFATVGSTSRADAVEAHFKYALPAGKTPADIVEIAASAAGRVQTWYRDGTLSEGTFRDLAAHREGVPFRVPTGKQATDILAVAIDGDEKVHAYFADGTFSVGSPTRLASVSAPAPFAVATCKAAKHLDHVEVTKDGSFFAVSTDGKASVGTAAALAATKDLYKVAFPGHCGMGTTIHEIGHAVGLFHEQVRNDRDDHVVINWANILPGKEGNFEKYSFLTGQDFGAYDFDSVMHYGSTSFSKNGEPTIVKKDGSLIAANRTALSPGDIAGVAEIYE